METNTFVDQVADKITHLGLNTLAILLLEGHKPLAFVASQLLLVAQPSLSLFFPSPFINNTANLLADSQQLEQLIGALEQRTGGQPFFAPGEQRK